MTFNEFQRELRAQGVEGPMAHIMTVMYEEIRAQRAEVEEMAKILLHLTDQMQNLAGLMELDVKELDEIKKRMGIVRSEPWNPGS